MKGGILGQKMDISGETGKIEIKPVVCLVASYHCSFPGLDHCGLEDGNIGGTWVRVFRNSVLLHNFSVSLKLFQKEKYIQRKEAMAAERTTPPRELQTVSPTAAAL